MECLNCIFLINVLLYLRFLLYVLSLFYFMSLLCIKTVDVVIAMETINLFFDYFLYYLFFWSSVDWLLILYLFLKNFTIGLERKMRQHANTDTFTSVSGNKNKMKDQALRHTESADTVK